jgi:hypothetical protein
MASHGWGPRSPAKRGRCRTQALKRAPYAVPGALPGCINTSIVLLKHRGHLGGFATGRSLPQQVRPGCLSRQQHLAGLNFPQESFESIAITYRIARRPCTTKLALPDTRRECENRSPRAQTHPISAAPMSHALLMSQRAAVAPCRPARRSRREWPWAPVRVVRAWARARRLVALLCCAAAYDTALPLQAPW